jgi:hypothetical protein
VQEHRPSALFLSSPENRVVVSTRHVRFVEAAREQDACMNRYPMAALERTMKIQEVILRALAKKIT